MQSAYNLPHCFHHGTTWHVSAHARFPFPAWCIPDWSLPILTGPLSFCRKQKKRADGTAEPEKVPLYRKVLLISGMVLLLLAVFFLLSISLIASFHPKAVQGSGAHG